VNVPVFVPTCDKYLWALRPFAYLFNTFWSSMQPVVVAGFSPPQFSLPSNIEFISVDPHSYPAAKWTDGLIKFLSRWNQDIFVFMLEDYWISRGVNHQAINSLADYMQMHPDVLRIDLTADRLHSGAAVDVDTWGYLDIIETLPGTPYQMSTQACLVNRKLFLQCLEPGTAPWEFEMHTQIPDGMRILGTRNYPVRYVNAIGMNLDGKYRYRTEHIREGLGGKTIERIPDDHVGEMLRRGILPPREQ